MTITVGPGVSAVGVFKGATASVDGLLGLVPAPTAGDEAKALLGDATWGSVPSGSGTVTGTNTGDQTTIVGITGTKAQFDTALTDGDFVYQGGALGTPLSGVATNLTGTAAGLTAGSVNGSATITSGTISGLTSLGVSGNVTVDTDTFVVDATNNTVGIGGTPSVTSSSKLRVRTTTDNNIYTGTYAGVATHLSINDAGSAYANYRISASDVFVSTNGVDRVKILAPSGRILSGVTLPTDDGSTGWQHSGTMKVSGALTASTSVVTPNLTLAGTAITAVTGTGSAVLSASPTFTTLITTPAINGGTAANDDITIQGTTNATRTTSYVNLQPNGGKVGIGGVTSPTAKIHAGAGTATANTAPYQDNDGTRETTARAGIKEFEKNHYATNQNLIRFAVGGTIFDRFADVSVGGAETDIFTFTTLANTFAVNGDKVIASYGGNFVTLGTELTQLKAYLAGTAIWDSTGITMASGTSSWRVLVELIRVSATVVRYVVSLNTSGASGYVYCTSGELTGLTLTNTNIVKLTGISSGVGSGVGDIVGKMAYGEFKPAYN